jgi:bifunctional non-homologous end joining protein LigD
MVRLRISLVHVTIMTTIVDVRRHAVAAADPLIVDGRQLKVTNLDKVLYPSTGFTKGEVIDYYRGVAQVMLPHLRGRPVTFKRYPDGVEGEFFFVKQCAPYRPKWVHTTTIYAETAHHNVTYCVIDDVPTLVWAANLAALELHTSLSHVEDLTRPTSLVFDLDPGAPATILECAQVGLWLRELASDLGLQSFPKVSGSKGLHIHVPINHPVTYATTKPFARALAQRLEAAHPDLVVANMRRARREGKVLIDWSQNDEHKTTVSVYSLRGRARPTVSTPVTWQEVEDALRARDAARLSFEAPQVLERIERLGDLYAPVLTLQQALPRLDAIAR